MAGRIPTAVAEQVYDVLMKYAEASPRYYDKELFIFQYGVLKDKKSKLRLRSIDGKVRYFNCEDIMNMRLSGHGANRVNPMLKKISELENGIIHSTN